MIKNQMLHQIDQRLKTIKNNNLPFGGVAVFLFGDLLQLKPTLGKYIFDEPETEGNAISDAIAPLWHSFKIKNLTQNHRQGDDFEYSEMLNRMRTGSLTDEDIDLLETRVMKEDDPGLPSDALYLAATNAEINKINDAKLEHIDSPLITVKAAILGSTNSSRKPDLGSGGEIKGTPLQYILKLKVGARVMLTFNLDTFDGLSNGAQGELLGYETNAADKVSRLYVHFFDNKVGRERREKCVVSSYLQQLRASMPDKLPTHIDMLEFSYSTSKRDYSTSVKNTALTFPIKLAWAISAHKIQGQTCKKPAKLIVNLQRVFEPAQAYVMMSRVENIEQLIIINDVCPKKIYANDDAVKELERLNDAGTDCDNEVEAANLRIMSLNIRSLPKHFVDLIKEPGFEDQDIILVQQTCLQPNNVGDQFEVENYQKHFTSRGNGKGLAAFYTDRFRHEIDINKVEHQISKFSSTDCDVINIYRSTDNTVSGQVKFLEDLNEVISPNKKTMIMGDFNSVFPDCLISRELQSWGYSQVIRSPTHIEGNIIDHCYVSDNVRLEAVKSEQSPVYYSDHDIIKIKLQ